MEATTRENYDNPALSTGLTIGSIFADFEAKTLANRKQVFSNAMSAADFRMSVYEQITAFANANAEAARQAFAEAGKFASKEIERAYNEGIRRVDENIKDYEKQGYKANLEEQSTANNSLTKKIATTLANLAGALTIGRNNANQQMLQITSIVNVDADDLAREIDDKQKIFLQKGVAGTYNKNGIATEISAVGELQMRQDSQKTLLEAQGDRSAEYGLYLIQISAHPSSCPLCTPWQARVLVDDVYKGGKPDGEHELLSTAIEAGLFHYNCRHTYIIYIPGYSRDNIFDYDKASKKLTAERYAIEQEQRYNERAIREWKRREQGSMTEQERILARRKISEWQAKQRALQKYAEEKRIPFYRQYQREAIGGDTKPTMSPYNPQSGSPLHYTPNVLTRVTDSGTMPVIGIEKLDDAPILPKEERTIDKCVVATNPNFSTEDMRYSQNCQRCVAAYEARRRGFDVQASEALVEQQDRLRNIYDEQGWANVFENGLSSFERPAGVTDIQVRESIKNRMSEYGDGARAIVSIIWKKPGSGGHVFIVEQVKGQTRFIDPQVGSKNCYSYFDNGKIIPNQTLILRVDDKKFTSLIDSCIK